VVTLLWVYTVFGCVCGSRDSTKSPASGIATVREHRLMSQWGKCANSHVRRSVFLCCRSGGCASMLADRSWSMTSPVTNTRYAPSTLCCCGKWECRGGHLACDTWWLLSRAWSRRTVHFVRLALRLSFKITQSCEIIKGSALLQYFPVNENRYTFCCHVLKHKLKFWV
jgi:hypothetical protein